MRGFVPAVLLLLFFTCASFLQASDASAWQRGVTIVPRWETDLSSDSFRQSVLQARNAKANHVTLQIIYWQPTLTDSEFLAGGATPTDQSLLDAVNFIHAQGMQASFKMQILTANLRWSAEIDAKNRDQWFANYTGLLVHYAKLAQKAGVEQMVLGSELTTMTSESLHPDNTRRWRDMIAAVRGVYSGKLTYSANWGPGKFSNEKGQIQFWDALDYLGVSGYYELKGERKVKKLVKNWEKWEKEDLRPFQEKWQKPVLFTEVGYKSVKDGTEHPWKWDNWTDYDPELQANAYEALFAFWSKQPYIVGVQLWEWGSDPAEGGEGDKDYTPKNKQAYNVLSEWFGKIATKSGEQAQESSGHLRATNEQTWRGR
jgi:hypothetical protein